MITIDTEKFLVVPQGWSVLEHVNVGEVKVVEGKLQGFVLMQAPCQGGIIPPVCNEIEKEINAIQAPVLNANVLDYLLDHPESIPDIMREHMQVDDDPRMWFSVWFCGTKYKDEEDERCIRGLSMKKDGTFTWGSVRIDQDGLLGDSMILHDSFKPPA